MIIFISGIHGVGKTTLAEKISRKLNVKHLSASDLIAIELGDRKKTKKAGDMLKSQNSLIFAMSKIKNNANPIILDGHFVLRVDQGIYTSIPEVVFKSIGIDFVILIEDEITYILNRLNERGDFSWNYYELKKMAELERKQAILISSCLGINFKSFLPNDIDGISNYVESCLRDEMR